MVAPSPETILLVDGYNVIGAWPKLQKAQRHHGLEMARQDLIEVLASYAAFHGCQTKIVFDAQYQTRIANQEIVTEQLEVHFTDSGQTADTYIEIFCAQSRHQLTAFKRIIVATSDRDQKNTVKGYGAEWMSANQLIQDIRSTTSRIRDRTFRNPQSQRKLLSSAIDPIAKQKLERLRFGLDP